MGTGTFTNEEIAYLRSLPAVARVSNGRIRYSEAFRRECMRRYHAGESPVRIFRDAGLDASLIGYKRIERCIARWRSMPDAPETVGGADGNEPGAARADGRLAKPFTPELNVRAGKRDLRDLLISQQVLLIEHLESEVERLRAEVGERPAK
ncbi:HTH domain-containing protein [Bifidobacterium stellenboschense]|uniref:Putative transposase n=1 Tax=Bifidobacterium stellenboschense TaxID=762211 RepID=A0A087DUB6_9BIFI|nr:HTH domain-containing protein [Bifidobacterium stellenboschense]KFI99116.1 putative transposase [Bifidobacterium stellenboschense]